MGVTTLGSLREPIPSCREAMEGETMAFSCPEGFTINSVVAYYGQNYGSCACPYDQQANNAYTSNGCQGIFFIVNILVNVRKILKIIPQCCHVFLG